MAGLNQTVARSVSRWRTDLRELTSGLLRDPFVKTRGRTWEREFTGEIGPQDIQYGVLIILLSLIPALVVAYTSPATQIAVLAGVFRAPLQAVISGFLTAILLYAGSHFNKTPRPFSVAFKLMLRVMSIHPLLAFLLLARLGEPLALLAYGLFVVRGVRKTFDIPLRNVLLLFGTIYIMFALITVQNIFAPMGSVNEPLFEFREKH